jgi:hypothetical protein
MIKMESVVPIFYFLVRCGRLSSPDFLGRKISQGSGWYYEKLDAPALVFFSVSPEREASSKQMKTTQLLKVSINPSEFCLLYESIVFIG